MRKNLKIVSAERGFSLIEVLVTMSILAIIVSIASPNITTSLAKQDIKSDWTTITNALQDAKIESSIRKSVVAFNYIEATAAEPAKVTVVDNANSKTIKSYNLDTGTEITLTNNVKKIEFNSTGTVKLDGVQATTDTEIKICHASVSNETPKTITISTNAFISHSNEGSCT